MFNNMYRTQVHVKLDNAKCTSQCFDNTDSAAEFIAQSMRQGWKPDLPIYAVQCEYCSTFEPPAFMGVLGFIYLFYLLNISGVVQYSRN